MTPFIQKWNFMSSQFSKYTYQTVTFLKFPDRAKTYCLASYAARLKIRSNFEISEILRNKVFLKTASKSVV